MDHADLPTSHWQSACKALVHFKVLQVQGLIRYNILNNVAASHSQDCLLPYIPNSNWEQSQCPCFLLGEQNELDPGKVYSVQTRWRNFFYWYFFTVTYGSAFPQQLNYFTSLSTLDRSINQTVVWQGGCSPLTGLYFFKRWIKCTNPWSSGGCLVNHKTTVQESLHYLFMPVVCCKDFTIQPLTGLFVEVSGFLSLPLGCPFSWIHWLTEDLRMHLM